MAETFAVMWEMETTRVPSMCDLGDLEFHLEDDDPHPLVNAIQQHFRDLFNRIDFTEAAALRKFYVEMRLFGDQQALDLQKAYKASVIKRRTRNAQ